MWLQEKGREKGEGKGGRGREELVESLEGMIRISDRWQVLTGVEECGHPPIDDFHVGVAVFAHQKNVFRLQVPAPNTRIQS